MLRTIQNFYFLKRNAFINKLIHDKNKETEVLNIFPEYYIWDNLLFSIDINMENLMIDTKFKKIFFARKYYAHQTHKELKNISFCEGIEEIDFFDYTHSLEGMVFPSTLKKICLGYNYSHSLTNVKFPENLEEITFRGNILKPTIDSLPLGIKKINLDELTIEIDNLPSSLKEIVIHTTKYSCLKKQTNPNTLLKKIPFGCKITKKYFTIYEQDFVSFDNNFLVLKDTSFSIEDYEKLYVVAYPYGLFYNYKEPIAINSGVVILTKPEFSISKRLR
jgi:hypothetical protein